MLQFLWVFGSCQADFVYVPIYMSCYDLHTATENNQKAREALEAFMSRLQASGPSLWQRWGVLEAGSARQPKLELLKKCYLAGCFYTVDNPWQFCILQFGICWITPPQPEGLTQLLRKRTKWRETVRQNHLVPTFDMIFIKGSLVANFRYTNFWVAWQE